MQWLWHELRFARVLDALPGDCGRVLDIGCGPGTFLGRVLPARRRFTEAVGIDVDPVQVEFARTTFGSARTHFHLGELASLGDTAGFDVIVSIEVVEHLPPETAPGFWSRVRGMCRPGGLVVLTTPNYRSHWPVIERILSRVGPVDYTEQHVNRYDRPRLTAELETAGLQVRTARTFFVIAPFLAAISSRLARRVDGLERRWLPGAGAETVVVAQRPEAG